jgi:hypothetical protein
MITEAEIIKLIEEGQEGPALDFKHDLPLTTDGDKAEFLKDVLALANSGGTAHIIMGIEDGTWKPVGIKTPHTPEQLNEILKDKSDPPLRVEYAGKDILHYKIGIIEITGDNPPYIVAVPDRSGGSLSANPQKQFFIERGTVFIRNFNMNEGARRTDLDKMYAAKYATPQADLRFTHAIEEKPLGDLVEVNIDFVLVNEGQTPATDPFVWLQFKNIQELVKCTGDWINVSHVNKNIPTITLPLTRPIYWLRLHTNGAVVRVSKQTKQIEAILIMQAGNMRLKREQYVIPLKSQQGQ